MDISKIAYRPVIKSRMEVFIADKHDQFIIDNINRHYGLAFLK
jgi:hypothetical protein